MRRRAVAAQALSRTQAQAEELAEEAEEAAAALTDAPDLTDLDLQLSLLTAEVATDRAAVAEARAPMMALPAKTRPAAAAWRPSRWSARPGRAAPKAPPNRWNLREREPRPARSWKSSWTPPMPSRTSAAP